MNYPKNRKPRDTNYAKGTQLINTIGHHKIQQYWEMNGTSATMAMLNKIAPFPVTKGIVRNLVKKHGWRRLVTDMNDPLFRLVLKDPARIPDFKHVQFMFRGIPIEDLICWIQNILQNHPNLCYCGFNRCSTHKGWLRGFETQLSELAIAIAYLEHATPAVKLTKGKKIHSYSLKHRMEQGYQPVDVYQGYVCNGTAILAAFLCGFLVEQCEKDPTYAWIGIAKVKQPYQRRLV